MLSEIVELNVMMMMTTTTTMEPNSRVGKTTGPGEKLSDTMIGFLPGLVVLTRANTVLIQYGTVLKKF